MGAVLGANHAVGRFDAQIARRVAMTVDGAGSAKARGGFCDADASGIGFGGVSRPSFAIFGVGIGAIFAAGARFSAYAAVVGTERQADPVDAFAVGDAFFAVFAFGDNPGGSVVFDACARAANESFFAIVLRDAFARAAVFA